MAIRTWSTGRSSILLHSVARPHVMYPNDPERVGCQQVRNMGRNYYVKDELGAPNSINYWRPTFLRESRLHGNIQGYKDNRPYMKRVSSLKDPTERRPIMRWQQTGIRVPRWPANSPYNFYDVVPGPGHPLWSHPSNLRIACLAAYSLNSPPAFEIQARKLCAELKDARYPVVYHTLTHQAHVLYFTGRVELERMPAVREFAHFMLVIAAGLGQLDAALLLHQLEKVDPRFVLPLEQRSIIARAAEENIDWRAMLAQCEYLVGRAKGKVGKGRLQGLELERCLEMLETAMSLTSPSQDPKITREQPPPDYLDAETLETFDPPYKLLLELTTAEIDAGNTSDDILELFKHASLVGAIEYKDPEVAWQYTQRSMNTEQEYTEDWVKCATIAATNGNADACFELAKYHLRKDGWYPSLTARTLDDIRRELRENAQRTSRRVGVNTVDQLTTNEVHDRIMAQKSEDLLQLQEGIEWTKTAAQLQVGDATKILNRYCIVSGILRQNGFLSPGYDVLLEAQACIKDCVNASSQKDRALAVLNEYLHHWDKRFVHELLEPELIDPLLTPTQKK